MKTNDAIDELEKDPNAKTAQKPILDVKAMFTYTKFNEWEDHGEGLAPEGQ
jgi:hypothetical protein